MVAPRPVSGVGAMRDPAGTAFVTSTPVPGGGRQPAPSPASAATSPIVRTALRIALLRFPYHPQHRARVTLQLAAPDAGDQRQRLGIAGALDVDLDQHGALVPTEAARPILKGAQRLMLRTEAQPAAAPRGRARATGPAPAPADDALFEALRAWRKAEAEAQGVPAYVIFHNETLAAIAASVSLWKIT